MHVHGQETYDSVLCSEPGRFESRVVGWEEDPVIRQLRMHVLLELPSALDLDCFLVETD